MDRHHANTKSTRFFGGCRCRSAEHLQVIWVHDSGEDRAGPGDVAGPKSIELLRAAVNRKPVKSLVPDPEPDSSSLRDKIQTFLTLVQFFAASELTVAKPTLPRDPTAAEFYLRQSSPNRAVVTAAAIGYGICAPLVVPRADLRNPQRLRQCKSDRIAIPDKTLFSNLLGIFGVVGVLRQVQSSPPRVRLRDGT
jgi:hypothetical protein